MKNTSPKKRSPSSSGMVNYARSSPFRQGGGKPKPKRKGGTNRSPKMRAGRKSRTIKGGIINQCIDDEQLEQQFSAEEASVQQVWEQYREKETSKAQMEAERRLNQAHEEYRKAELNIDTVTTDNEKLLNGRENGLEQKITKDNEAWSEHKTKVKKLIQDLCKVENDINELEEVNSSMGYDLTPEDKVRKEENRKKLAVLRTKKAKIGNDVNEPFKPMNESSCTIC